MLVKQKREYFISLYQKLSYFGELKGARFSFIIARNKEIISKELDKVRKMAEVPETYKEYDKARVAVNEKYCLRDNDGKPVIKNNEYQILVDKQELLDKEIDELKETYKEVVEEHESQKVEIDDFCKEEIELDLIEIPLKFIPESITVDQMEILSKIVKE